MRKITTALVVCSMLLVGCAEKDKNVSDKDKSQQQQNKNEETNQSKLEMSTFQSNVETSITSNAIKFRIAVVNSGDKEATFGFLSGQQFDILVKDKNGEKVYQYAEGQTFSQEKTNVVVGPNKAYVWENEWLVDTSLLKEGKYTVESSISVSQINDTIVSSTDVSKLNAASDFNIEHKTTTPTPTKNPVVEGKTGVYKVTGIVSTDKNVYYSVEDGHNVLVDETTVNLKKGTGDTHSFEININIPKENLPTNGTLTLILYSRDVDGAYTPLQTITLEQFTQ
ncbi:MAG: BsuPI-related putative proteinase inhibitor [Bacillaceae bacterium]